MSSKLNVQDAVLHATVTVMSEVPSDLAREKHATINTHVDRFTVTINDALATLPAITEGTADPNSEYLNALEAITHIRAVCDMYIDLIGSTAHQQPNPLSIPKIAEATGVSINTVRARMPSIKQGRSAHPAPPF